MKTMNKSWGVMIALIGLTATASCGRQISLKELSPITMAARDTGGGSIQSSDYELGMRFTATVAGKIHAIRYYKSPAESGVHTGKLYSSSGALLASVQFSNESSSGWQQANLTTPVSIAANTEYTVSVNSTNSQFVSTPNGFASQISNGNLRSVVGNNGVYGPIGFKPTLSTKDTNYFRDVVFVPN